MIQEPVKSDILLRPDIPSFRRIIQLNSEMRFNAIAKLVRAGCLYGNNGVINALITRYVNNRTNSVNTA